MGQGRAGAGSFFGWVEAGQGLGEGWARAGRGLGEDWAGAGRGPCRKSKREEGGQRS